MARKVIGILGGMGPDATAHFFGKIVSMTPASSDQEHIPIVIYNNPQIPDRTAAIRNRDTTIIQALEASLKVLEKSAPDFICIPCNTVHYYFEEMQRCSSIPIINLVETVVEVALKELPNLARIGLLATTGTIKSGLYQNAFARQGV
ncbi:MAG: aspartate/glutamate racemase family protein, partial [bacterium]